jgi:sugar/nucleoside kinase (ribokinase family)
MSILSVGTVAFDAIETPFGKTDKIIGGAATYFCLAASFFSNKINLVSVVGDDFPESAIEMLKKHNINTKGLEIVPGEKTFFWSGRYHLNMNIRDTLETQLNVLEKFNPVLPKEFKQPEFLMLGNLTPSIQKKAIDQITKQPKLVILDTMNFWMDHFMEDLKETIKKIDVLTINDDEARQLSQENSLVKAAETILKMGPKYLIIKKGEHGALLFDKKEMFYVPALPLEKVLDPTGAGDSFAGGFVGSLDQSKEASFKNMKKALINATAVASFCVEDFGTKKLTQIEKADLEKRAQEIIKLVSL